MRAEELPDANGTDRVCKSAFIRPIRVIRGLSNLWSWICRAEILRDLCRESRQLLLPRFVRSLSPVRADLDCVAFRVRGDARLDPDAFTVHRRLAVGDELAGGLLVSFELHVAVQLVPVLERLHAAERGDCPLAASLGRAVAHHGDCRVDGVHQDWVVAGRQAVVRDHEQVDDPQRVSGRDQLRLHVPG